MDLGLITLLTLVSMFGLMLLRIPLAVVTLVVALVLIFLFVGPNGLRLAPSRIGALAQEYTLVAVPFFILMAGLLERSGVAEDIYDALSGWSRRIPGGLAVQTLVMAVIMAAMMGVAGGEIVVLGLVALPQMIRLGYDRRLVAGTICAGGSLGAMIPPSVVLIFYGLMAGVSIGQLFMAALLPGLLMAMLYAGYIVTRAILNPELCPVPPPPTEADAADRRRLLRSVVPPVALILLVLGTIYGGLATVTEAAGIGAIGALVIALARGRLSLADLRSISVQTFSTCGNLIWLTFGATTLIGAYNLLGGTAYLKDLFVGLPVHPQVLLLLILAVFLVLGMFMDWIGICLLTMPVFVPVIVALGFDPIWFGVVFCMAMQIAYVSPPFGPSCFYLHSVAPDISLNEIFISVMPFIALQFVAIALVIAIPDIALWLPRVAAP